MEQIVFKLCMIATSHEYYKFTLLSVTFDLCQGHRFSAQFRLTILSYAVVFVVTFIKLGMNITNVDLYPNIPLS